VLLRQYRAQYPGTGEFEETLFKMAPFDLYVACLKELAAKFEAFPRKDEQYLQLLFYLHTQLHKFDAASLLAQFTPTLEQLFAK